MPYPLLAVTVDGGWHWGLSGPRRTERGRRAGVVVVGSWTPCSGCSTKPGEPRSVTAPMLGRAEREGKKRFACLRLQRGGGRTHRLTDPQVARGGVNDQRLHQQSLLQLDESDDVRPERFGIAVPLVRQRWRELLRRERVKRSLRGQFKRFDVGLGVRAAVEELG